MTNEDDEVCNACLFGECKHCWSKPSFRWPAWAGEPFECSCPHLRYFHGTTASAAASIAVDGLLPNGTGNLKEPPRVWLSSEPPAPDYIRFLCGEPDAEVVVFEVDPGPYEVHGDDPYWVEDPIPPVRLRRVL